jgi:ABC-type polysaccharide/polyol phosphate export permease
VASLQASADGPLCTYADLLRYRDLFGNLVRRDVQARYKGSLLGVAWSLANPLLLMAIYVLVFSTLWRVTEGIPHYPLYLLSGLAPWLFFSGASQAAARSLLDHAPLVRKTRFPRQLVPLSAVAAQLVVLGAMLAVLVVVNMIAIPETRDTAWLAVPLAAVFVALAAGFALAVGAANVVLRDVEHLLTAALLPWFFLTPILYSFEQVGAFDEHPGVVRLLRWGNPITPPIEAIRAPLWAGEWPRAADVVYLVLAAAGSLAVGALVFRRVDDRIAVEI